MMGIIGHSNPERKLRKGIIFGTPGTAYLHYNLAVSLSVYAVYSPRLSVQFYLLSDDC